MKALLAFEPFHQDKERLQGMHRLLAQIAGSPSGVELAFIVTHQEAELNEAKNIREKERYTSYPVSIVNAALKKANLKIADGGIHVLDQDSRSVTPAVDRLLKLAASRKADLVGLYTHARAGFTRFVLGSFAETAIHRSKVSLLLVNPKCKIAPKIRKVVFATDFGPSSAKHLRTTLALCRTLKANLTILHHAEVTYGWSLNESSPHIQAYRKNVDKWKADAEQQCRKAGITGEVVITSEFIGTTDFILRSSSKAGADLIVMSAKVGPTAALMGGSVSRKVVRASDAPVLILK